jgi:D-cysteine desulfhydrase family pyridoxal phosphate-dependent enzyme
MDERRLEALRAALASKPRLGLGHFPTPLDEAPSLSARLGVRVLVKRDDNTGLALGGNKVRKLEFLLADALANGANTVVTTGGSQSNHARLAAAACRRAGLECHLVLDRGVHPELQGNLLLDRLFGAHVHLIESPDPADAMAGMEEVASRLRASGGVPYIIPRGGSIPAGATGYAAMAAELLQQLHEQQRTVSYLYLGTGSTGTHAGTLAGLTAAGASIWVQGISVSWPQQRQEERVFGLANATLEHLGLPDRVAATDIHVDERFRGPGYGIPTPETMAAIETAALDEALVLDPVYTGKAMAGLIGHAREGRFGPEQTVVFLHTGGAPALFAYHRETADALSPATT